MKEDRGQKNIIQFNKNNLIDLNISNDIFFHGAQSSNEKYDSYN